MHRLLQTHTSYPAVSPQTLSFHTPHLIIHILTYILKYIHTQIHNQSFNNTPSRYTLMHHPNTPVLSPTHHPDTFTFKHTPSIVSQTAHMYHTLSQDYSDIPTDNPTHIHSLTHSHSLSDPITPKHFYPIQIIYPLLLLDTFMHTYIIHTYIHGCTHPITPRNTYTLSYTHVCT